MIGRLLQAVLAGTGLLIGLLCTAAFADRRVALVIGNSNYQSPELVLANPRNDAEDVARELRELGFETVLALDADRRGLYGALAKFETLSAGADAVLVFYAGHAIQVDGQNYLMPVDTDARMTSRFSVRSDMLPLDDIRIAIARATGVKILILDACRNNPLVDRLAGLFRSAGGNTSRGLARIDKAQGTVVAYATAANDVAQDGAGRNSPFTSALLRRMRDPGLDIVKLFQTVGQDVYEATGQRQRPELILDFYGDFVLNNRDRLAWERVKDSSDPEVLRDFIRRFPSSRLTLQAERRLNLILERLAKEREEERQRIEAARRQEEEALRRQRAAQDAAEQARLQAEREAAQRQLAEERARREAAEAAQRRLEAEQQRLAAEQARIAGAEARLKAEREAVESRHQRQPDARIDPADVERLAAEAKRLQDERDRFAAEARRLQDEHDRLAAEAAKQRADELARQREAEAAERKRVAALQQEEAARLRICRQETDEFRRLKAEGAKARERLVRFEREMRCAALRPEVLAALNTEVEEAPPARPAARPRPSRPQQARPQASESRSEPARPREQAVRPAPSQPQQPQRIMGVGF